MKKLLTTLLIIVVIAAIALPKVIGSQGRKAHNNFFQEQAQTLIPGVTVESEKINDGWFNSEGQHRVKLSQAAVRKMFPMVKDIKFKQELDLLVDTKFHHGPFAFTALGSKGGSFSPVLGVSESTFKIDSPKGQVALPGKLYTQVDTFGDGGKAIYVIEEYKHESDDATINFDGLNIEFDVDNKGTVLDREGKAGTLSIKGKNGGEMLLTGMNFDSELDKEHGMWFGDTDFEFDTIKFSDDSGMNFSISDVKLSGGNDGSAQKFDSAAKFSIGEFVVSDMKFEDFTLNYAISNLDTEAMAKISEASQQGVTGSATVMQEMKKIVERSPQININELSLKTPGGKIEASLDLGLPDEVDMSFFPLSLLPQIQGNGAVRIPEGVVPMLDQFKPGLGAQLDMLGQMGMLEKKGNDYIAKLKMQDGSFTVNGNAVPLPGLF